MARPDAEYAASSALRFIFLAPGVRGPRLMVLRMSGGLFDSGGNILYPRFGLEFRPVCQGEVMERQCATGYGNNHISETQLDLLVSIGDLMTVPHGCPNFLSKF
jgi:hypothetical protein